MREALEAVATGEVTVASRDVELDGVAVRKGAWLGLADGPAVAAGEDFDEVARAVRRPAARAAARRADAPHRRGRAGARRPPAPGSRSGIRASRSRSTPAASRTTRCCSRPSRARGGPSRSASSSSRTTRSSARRSSCCSGCRTDSRSSAASPTDVGRRSRACASTGRRRADGLPAARASTAPQATAAVRDACPDGGRLPDRGGDGQASARRCSRPAPSRSWRREPGAIEPSSWRPIREGGRRWS